MSEPRKYTYGIYRVHYARGYRMEPKPLPHWMHLTITTEGNSKYLTVHSRIHINKEVRMLPDYSSNFTDNEIIKDLTGKIHQRFID